MVIRLRNPRRARLVVACAVLALVTAGVTLLLRDAAPPAYQPPPPPRVQGLPHYVTYAYQDDRDAPPGPATITGAVMLAVASGLGLGGCLIRRRRPAVA